MISTAEFNPISLLERIKNAENNEELLVLIIEGDGYRFASDKTRRRWVRAASSRESQLVTESKQKPKSRAKSDKKGSKKGNN